MKKQLSPAANKRFDALILEVWRDMLRRKERRQRRAA